MEMSIVAIALVVLWSQCDDFCQYQYPTDEDRLMGES